MKYLLVFLLLALSARGYSQFFIGDSRKDVKSILQKNNIKFTEDPILGDTTNRISWLVENEFQAIWVLDTHGNVIRQTLIPEKENGTNEFVTWFNRDFVIISETEWKNYSHGIIYHIKLEHILTLPLFTVTLTRLPDSGIQLKSDE